MAIKLKDTEEVKGEVHFHWSAFIVAKLWAGVGILAVLGLVIGSFAEKSAEAPEQPFLPTLIWMSALFFGPFLYKWLQNKSKSYVVTNQRVYVEEGILSKSKVDLPLNKINDVSVKQGLVQRMFGSGNLLLLTGNNKPTLIKDIDNPDNFKNVISDMIDKKAA